MQTLHIYRMARLPPGRILFIGGVIWNVNNVRSILLASVRFIEAGMHGAAVFDRSVPQGPSASVFDLLVAY